MFSLTIFKNTFDNRTHRSMNLKTWNDFQDLLQGLSQKEGQKGGNNSSPLISPATYFPNTTRSNKNVDYWGSWCALDVDDFCDFHRDELWDDLRDICGDYEYICYSTASSTPIAPKFRLVFPLTRKIYAKEIAHFWYALNKETKEIGDTQTKDRSRMYYVPAIYPDAFNFYHHHEGEFMDPDVIMGKYAFTPPSSGNSFLERLPESVRQEVINYRKEQLTNKSIVWNSYRDCPFFPKKLAQEYMAISSGGWYHKMYQIMIAIAGNAIKREYPITAKEIALLCKEFDQETGNWYENRPLELEADGAIEYVYKN